MSDLFAAPNFEIEVHATMEHTKCDLCVRDIDPERHSKYITIGAVNTEAEIKCHVSCFEKAAWTMTYFATTYDIDSLGINEGIKH